jgi:hypothetical protein
VKATKRLALALTASALFVGLAHALLTTHPPDSNALLIWMHNIALQVMLPGFLLSMTCNFVTHTRGVDHVWVSTSMLFNFILWSAIFYAVSFLRRSERIRKHG